MRDNLQEIFPIVDEEGAVVGKATRGECHSGTKLLHPVVHLHVFNEQGEVYLQKRPEWKDIQPGKWDTAVGGHLDYGETPEEALCREVREELGITDFVPQKMGMYVFESQRERELVYVNRTTYSGTIQPSQDELDGGRFWSMQEISDAMGKNILTPNFESEFKRFFLEKTKGKMKKLSIVLLLLLTILSSCVDNSIEDNNGSAQDVPLDPGKKYTERTFSVNRNGKDAGKVTMRFYDDMPNVPYIAAAVYYRMMMPNAITGVTRQGNNYLLTASGATATVDVVNDVMISEAYNDFVNLMSLISPGLPSFETCFNPFLRYDSHKYEPTGVTVTLDFRKYGIDLCDDGRDTWFPFATINDIFTDVSMHMAGFNGNSIIVNDDVETSDLSDIDPDFTTPAYSAEKVGKDLAAFRYAELCFVIDNFYGYPGRNRLEKQGLREKGLDATLNAVSGGKEVKQLLQSENQTEFVVGTDALHYLMDDGGHTGMVLSNRVPKSIANAFSIRYDEAFKRIPAGARQLIMDTEEVRAKRIARRKELNAIRNKNYGSSIYVKSQDGQTAVFVMTSFMDLNSAGWKNYYASNHTSEDWQRLVDDKKQDLVVQTVEALKRARSEGVKNLVLDVSINGGGEDDPTTAIVALLGDKTGKQQARRKTYSWDMNMLTRQYLTKTFLVDRNFDGKFDELDDQQDWTGDLNIVVLTSEATFSNASVFAAKMKDYGYQIWGQQSGGGACSIQEMATPDGMGYRISSYRSHTTDMNRKSIDGGTPVDRQLTNEQLYDIEYLNKQFPQK